MGLTAAQPYSPHVRLLLAHTPRTAGSLLPAPPMRVHARRPPTIGHTALLTRCSPLAHAPQTLELTALVPPWLKVCCPNVTMLELVDCFPSESLLLLKQQPPAPRGTATAAGAAAAAPPAQPAALTCRHLRHVDWRALLHDYDADGPLYNHVRQQLAALPSLSSLISDSVEWMTEPALVSTSLTSLINATCLNEEEDEWSTRLLRGVSVQFPALRELAIGGVIVGDDGLEALLLGLPHLRRVDVGRFVLQRSHIQRACQWEHLQVDRLGVDSFARLPLERIPRCTWSHFIIPSRDPLAVARVAEAVRRWGQQPASAWPPDSEVHRLAGWAQPAQLRCWIRAQDPAALLATLGPLLAALPPHQRRTQWVDDPHNLTPDVLRALGQRLHPGVAVLQLVGVHVPCWSPDVYPALLPSLPATVEEVQLDGALVRYQDDGLVALCVAAVRPIRVGVPLAAQRARLSARLGRAQQGGASLVTLVAGPKHIHYDGDDDY